MRTWVGSMFRKGWSMRFVPSMRGVRCAHVVSASALIALLAIFGVAGDANAAERLGAWKEVKSEDGVLVARRAVPGSSLDEFFGRGVVAAPLPEVLAVLMDTPHRPEWSDRCVASREVERLGEWSHVIYDRTKASWPAADRDAVIRVDTRFDAAAGVVVLDFRSVVDPRVPPVAGVVRVRSLGGRWVLRPVDDGRSTDVVYDVRADPGGDLPAWLANRVSKDLPFKTIVAIRKQVKRRSYPEFEAAVRQRPDYQAIMARAR